MRLFNYENETCSDNHILEDLILQRSLVQEDMVDFCKKIVNDYNYIKVDSQIHNLIVTINSCNIDFEDLSFKIGGFICTLHNLNNNINNTYYINCLDNIHREIKKDYDNIKNLILSEEKINQEKEKKEKNKFLDYLLLDIVDDLIKK